MKESRQCLEAGLMRSWESVRKMLQEQMKASSEGQKPEGIHTSQPQSSHTACQARGANCEASKVLCDGILVLGAVQVVLSFGSMPRRVQTLPVTSAACSLVKACGILRTC